LTCEDEKSQAPAFPHSSQSPTNTSILGAAQTFASKVRGEGEGKSKRSSGKTRPINSAASHRQAQGVKPGPGFKLHNLQSSGRLAQARVSSHTHLTFTLLQQDQRHFFPSFTLPQAGRHELQSFSQS